MYGEYFHKTTIGANYLKTGKLYPVDTLLDYLSGLKRMQREAGENEAWKYNYEIDAVKEILRIQTA